MSAGFTNQASCRHDLIAFGKAIPECDATDGVLRDQGMEEGKLRKVDSHEVGDAVSNQDSY
jgi:hypothetical protein